MMNESRKFWFKVLLSDVALLFGMIVGLNIFNHILKNQVSEAFTNEVRNDFLMSNRREINRKILNFIDYTDFLEIRSRADVFKKNNIESYYNNIFIIEIAHYVYSDSNKEKTSNILYFKYSPVSFTFYAIIGWGVLNMVLSFFLPLLRKHLRQQVIREQEILRTMKEAEMAFQVSHDIRSPLTTLNIVAENLRENVEDYQLFQKSIQRINEITNNLLKNNQNGYVELLEFYPLFPLLQEIVDEKNQEYLHKKIEINLNQNSNSIALVVPSDFKRVISNLINNSVEAVRDIPKVGITLFEEKNYAKILISDNGKGISKEIIQNLGAVSITTKVTGNGLGLKHAFSTIKEWGGVLNIIESNSLGTTIEIVLKAQVEQVFQALTILVDDDDLTRATWESRAKKAKIDFKSFKDVVSFKKIINDLDKNTILYIDSELGDFKGEALAQELYSLGFSNISIASGHPPVHFKEFSFLRSIISKKAPF